MECNFMPLTKNCKEYASRSLLVLPYYGHGWTRPDLDSPPQDRLASLGPEPFHLKIEDFILCDKQLMGVSGTIDEQKHQFDKYWCGCLLRNTDDSDFTAHPGQYMVWIAQKKLPIHPAPYPGKALYEWVTFDKSVFCLCGFGTVAESVQWIRDIYKRTMDSRKLVAKPQS